ARHLVRRENRRLIPFHSRTGVRGSRQRKPKPGPLGYGQHSAPRLRRRRNLFRRQVNPEKRGISSEAIAFAELALIFGRASLVESWCLLCALRPAQQVQLHRHDLSTFVQLEVSDLKHWRAFGWTGPCSRQLDNNLLRIGIQGNRSNFERRRKLERADLERYSNEHRCAPLR